MLEDLESDVAFLIDDEGRDMTLRKVATGSYSAATSSATVTAVDHAVRGLLLNYSDFQRGSDSLIKAGDRKAVIKALGISAIPLPNDIIVIDNREFAIVNARIIEQKGETIVYICQIRG